MGGSYGTHRNRQKTGTKHFMRIGIP